jgi:hypothetical protein
MSCQTVFLRDAAHPVIATAQVVEKDSHFAGSVDLTPMPAELRQKFEEYEQIVEGQIFSLLDEIEDQIARFSLKVVWTGGREEAVEDLQIYPSTRRISFRVAKPAVDGTPAGSSRLHAAAELGTALRSEPS